MSGCSGSGTRTLPVDPCGSRAAHRPWLARRRTDGRTDGRPCDRPHGRWATSGPRGRPGRLGCPGCPGCPGSPGDGRFRGGWDTSPCRAMSGGPLAGLPVDGRTRAETRVPVGFPWPWAAWPMACRQTNDHPWLAETELRLALPSDAPCPLIRTNIVTAPSARSRAFACSREPLTLKAPQRVRLGLSGLRWALARARWRATLRLLLAHSLSFPCL